MKKSEERIRKLKASLANTVLILSIFVVVFPLILPTMNATAKTVYVDEGESIQAAINNASPGDTIHVNSSTYIENINIWKTLTLEGNGSDTTIIDGNHTGTVITISASSVRVSEFTIKNGSNGIEINNNYINISKNIISYNSIFGIGIPYGRNNNEIYDNDINNNTLDGITLGSAHNNTIIDNDILYNSNGITLINSHSGPLYYPNNNIIDNNRIKYNGNDGIKLDGGRINRISNNTISNNQMNGIILNIYSKVPSRDNTIENNTINHNILNGIAISENCNFNDIKNNDDISNNENCGIKIYESNNITISGNKVWNNKEDGINVYFYDYNIDTYIITLNDEIEISNNDIQFNEHNGINLYYIHNSTISNNNVSYNNQYGIIIDHESMTNKIEYNTEITSNSLDGIHLKDRSDNNLIKGNLFVSNRIGVYINTTSHLNKVINNYINYSHLHGIRISNSMDNNLTNNQIVNNETTEFGIFIEDDYRNYITHNNSVDGENLFYFYDVHGNESNLFKDETFINLSTPKVINLGKLSFIECNFTHISNKIISNTPYGVFIFKSNNISLWDNSITDVDEYGLYIEGDYRHNISTNNTVDGEPIYYYYDEHGNASVLRLISDLNLTQSNVSNVGKITIIDCSYFLLQNNNVSNNDFGIFIHGSNNITLWNNNMSTPINAGLFIDKGFYHHISTNNTANNQTIFYYTNLHGNESDYIINESYIINRERVSNVGLLSYVGCSYMEIRNNDLRSNYGSGIFVHSSFNMIIRNNSLNSNSNGITIHSSYNRINLTENTINSNDNGIFLYKSKNVKINKTEISSCETGIYIEKSIDNEISELVIDTTYTSPGIYLTESMGNRIRYNNFTGSAYAVRSQDSSPLIENNEFYKTAGITIKIHNNNDQTKIKNNSFIYHDINVSNLNKALHVAIYMTHSSPLIENNTSIYPYIPPQIPRHNGNNFASKGHIAVYQGSSPNIRDNYFYGSSWGISLEASGWAFIDNNTIERTDISIGVASKPIDQWEYGENSSNTASYVIVNNTQVLYAHSWGINFNQYNSGNVTNCSILYSGGIDGRGININGKASQFIAHNNISYNEIGIKSYPGKPCPIIFDNDIIGNEEGITTEGTDSSLKIEDNYVSDNTYGILGWNHDNYIANNTMISNDYSIWVFNTGSPHIFNNSISSSKYHGINVTDGSSPIIENNDILWSGQCGIYLESSNFTVIESNQIIDNNLEGIHLNGTYGSHNNLIINNNIENNSCGIYMSYSNGNNITNNGIMNNHFGIGLYVSDENIIDNNNATNNNFSIYLGISDENVIRGNNASNNINHGILLSSSRENVISENIVNSNGQHGIELTSSSELNEISGNTVNSNGNNGIYFILESNNNTISYNDILTNDYGIYLWNSTSNLVYHNNIINNTNQAYDNGNTTQWDNRYPIGGNYWDDFDESSEGAFDNNSGPSQSIPGSDGIVDSPYIIDGDSNDTYPLMNPIVNNRVQRPPIRIDSNSDFDSSHGVSSGSGIEIDPWIIESFDINGFEYGYCIYIGNTTEYFIVRDSYLHDANRGINPPQTSDSGIILDNVQNGTLRNNIASSNVHHGIYLTESSNNTIENNTCNSNSHEGIELDVDCDNNELIGNTVKNSQVGIYLYQSSYNNLTNNVASVTERGIWTISCSDNNIMGNNASSNDFNGIYLWFDSNTKINNNTALDNQYGIFIIASNNIEISGNDVINNTKGILIWSSSHNNTISYNNVSFNDGNGIELYSYSVDNEINNNDIFNNSDDGIYITNSSNNNITQNIMCYNGKGGVSTYVSSNILIEENTITYNHIGLNSYNSSPVIRYNELSYNNVSGIGDIYYSNAIIENNTITHNLGSGIKDMQQSNSTINNNTISYNYVGIYCIYNSCSIITYNNITYNTNGIDTETGSNVTIHWNNIYNNTNKSVRNFDSSINLSATHNYWGSDLPDPDDFYGEVNYSQYESTPIEDAGPQ